MRDKQENNDGASLLPADPLASPAITEALPDHERAIRAALTVLEERIRAKFTPALNTGSAHDALILVGAALREVLAEVGSGTQAAMEPADPTRRSAAK